MIRMEVRRITGDSIEECLEKLAEAEKREKVKPLGEELLGLDRHKSTGEIARDKGSTTPYRWEPSTLAAKRPADEATLLTLRRDLVSLREKMLKGVGRRVALLELDYTIDQLDNTLAEM